MMKLDTRLKELQSTAEKQSTQYSSSRQLLHQNIVDAYLWWRDAQNEDGYLLKLYDTNAIRYKKTKSNKPNFYPLVRLVWDIDVSTKASTISNWANSLAVLDETYASAPNKFPQPRADLINYIDSKGGLKGLRGEKQLTADELEKEEDLGFQKPQRGRKKQTTPPPQNVIERRKQLANDTTPLATTPAFPSAVTSSDGFVVLLGRKNDKGEIEIVSSTYKDEAVTEALWAAANIERTSVTPSLRLIAESIEPHSIPPKLEPFRKKFFAPSVVKRTRREIDPNDSTKTINTTFYVKQSTRLRIRPNQDDILLSNGASDASLTTHIKPKSMQLPTDEVVLRGSDRSWIETELLNGQKLDLYSAEPTDALLHSITGEKSKYILQLESNFGHKRKLHFYDTAELEKDSNSQPEVRDATKLKFDWEITAKTQWLKHFDAMCIDNWLSHTRGMFNKKQMLRVALIPSATELKLKHWWLGAKNGYERENDTLFGKDAKATLNVKEPKFDCSPKDLAVVFSTLPEMHLTCGHVIIRANANVMQISYSTDLAEYETFIPAVNDEGKADATAFDVYGA
jgi:hypothetical protein